MTSPFSHDARKLEALAIDAGNAIMEVREAGVEAASKDDGTPVTEADLAADKIIREGLTEIAPGIPAITEETYIGGNGDEPDAYWCVDPLDGTRGFINGGKNFTVNIALIEKRAPVFGVIYAPALGALWCGVVGGSATKREGAVTVRQTLEGMGDAAPISVRRANTIRPDVVATRAHRTPLFEEWLSRIDIGEHISVSSSLKFCMVAEGRADFYPRIGTTMEWDTAAGHGIVVAAGGRVIVGGGGALSYGKPDRRNGFFAAMGSVDAIPDAWMPPSGGDPSAISDA